MGAQVKSRRRKTSPQKYKQEIAEALAEIDRLFARMDGRRPEIEESYARSCRTLERFDEGLARIDRTQRGRESEHSRVMAEMERQLLLYQLRDIVEGREPLIQPRPGRPECADH